MSPKKQRSAAPEKPEKIEKPAKKPTSRTRTAALRNTSLNDVPSEQPQPNIIVEIPLEPRPPKTPAAETVLSPPSTQPSASRAESKDTPPPGDLTLGGQTGTVARPSRRARPQVSYKEPSLNTKMRRPSKELVDAVIDLSRRTSVDPPQPAPNSARVEIKEELEESWKPMGASGSLQVGGGTEAGSPLRQKLDRREESEKDKKPERQKLNSEAAERAIEKLIEETSTGKRKSLTNLSSHAALHETESLHPMDEVSRSSVGEKGDMAIFEFTSSSPPHKTAVRPKVSLASAVREKRRHSSVPSTTGIEERTSRQHGSSIASTHKRTMSGSNKAAPVAGLARSTATARASMKEREREREKRTSTLGSSGTSSDVGVKESGEGNIESRDARAASRRKSMMV